MRERIYKDRIYFVAWPQGISGFREPDTLAIMNGATVRAKQMRLQVGEFTRRIGDLNRLQWRLENGRFPEFQDRVSYSAACDWVAAEVGRVAVVIETP